MKDATKELFREIALNALRARMKVTLELTDNDEHSTAVIAKRDNNTQALTLTCSPTEEADEGESIIIDDLGAYTSGEEDEDEGCEEDEPLDSAQSEYEEDAD